MTCPRSHTHRADLGNLGLQDLKTLWFMLCFVSFLHSNPTFDLSEGRD